MIALTDEQILFIDEFATIPFDTNYFYDVYGEDKIKSWLAISEIAAAIRKRKQEVKREKAKKEALLMENVGMLKNKALENIVKCLNDFKHPECIKTSMRIMDGEFNYAKKRAEVEGARAGSESKEQYRALEIVRRSDVIDKGSS